MQNNFSSNKLFYLILLTVFTINLDHGIIPAATQKIEQTFQMNNEQLGILGSIVYGGIVSLSIFSGQLLLKYDIKKIIIICLATMLVTLIGFVQNYQCHAYYYFLRFLTGFTQAPLIVYFPVWIDHFGNENKTILLTLYQGASPIGIFSGYVLSSVIAQLSNWQWCFYIQICMLIPPLIIFILIDREDIDVKLSANNNQLFSNSSYCQLCKKLFSNTIFLCTMFILGVIYFSVSGIQFWISNYLEIILKYPQYLVNSLFSIVSITAPVSGVVFGGVITQVYAGGYDSPLAIYVCLVFSILSISIGLFVPFSDNIYIISILIWLFLFFGGGMVPPYTEQGIMLSSVPDQLRSFANSSTITFQNLFGFLPAPFLYGYLTQFGTKAGITFIMFYPLSIFIFLAIAIYKLRQGQNKEEKYIKEQEFNIV